MKALSEYTTATPAADLYIYLSELILSEKITSFTELMEQCKDIPLDQKSAAVFSRLSKLIRKLNWGFFKDLDPDTYPKLWKQLVLQHPQLKRCGELKRNLTISDVYIAILDLHGYTRFCEDNKNNLSMLQMLDDMIQHDIVALAREYGVLLQRRNGDEMIYVGTTALDMVMVTLRIVDYFSRKRILDLPGQGEKRSGYKIILQDMRVSAGISGGKKFTPFIITREGDISGSVINTAARLQTRANEISGGRSCILMTRAALTNLNAETQQETPALLRERQIAFLDCGWVSFKGIDIALVQLLLEPSDRYKLDLEPDYQRLYKAVENGAWRDNIYVELVSLLRRLLLTMPAFRFEGTLAGSYCMIRNDTLADLARDALQKFKAKQEYSTAIGDLEQLVLCCKQAPDFDRLCLEYADSILVNYRSLKSTLDARIEEKVLAKAQTSLPAKYRQLFEESVRNTQIIAMMKDELRRSFNAMELAKLWQSVVDEKQTSLPVEIYSGKR